MSNEFRVIFDPASLLLRRRSLKNRSSSSNRFFDRGILDKRRWFPTLAFQFPKPENIYCFGTFQTFHFKECHLKTKGNNDYASLSLTEIYDGFYIHFRNKNVSLSISFWTKKFRREYIGFEANDDEIAFRILN